MDNIAEESVVDEPVPAPTNRSRIWPVFVAAFLAFVGSVGLSVVAIAVLVVMEISQGARASGIAKTLPQILMLPATFTAIIVISEVPIGLAAMIPAWLSPVPFRERLGLLPAKRAGSVYMLAMLGSIVPLAIALAAAQVLAWIVPPDESFEMLFDNLTLASAVPFVLSIAVLPGICEELLFRGYLQRRLLQRWSPFWAIGVTSLIFAVIHVQPHTVVAAFPLGIWFGIVAWRCGSIGPSILCHAFVNGGLNAWRVAVKFAEISETAQLVFETAAVLVGLICCALLLRRFAVGNGEVTSSVCQD